ncbi:MAG: DUF1178 family protein [Alphaproteobacteria bacterium]|nr:DUF1178 family protein [Alphaproteobacteria bacterium]
MIKYRLRCGEGHAFDKWFKNMAEYDELYEAEALACPQCGSKDVKKAVMAPSIDSEGMTTKSYSRKGQAAESFVKNRSSSCNVCSPNGTCPFSG